MAKSDMANFNSFYTQITRAKKNITLYTDNKEQLAANVQKTDNTKSTLDYTIKKREKPSLEKEQPIEKNTYKDIHVSKTKEVDKPLEVTKGTRDNLKKVGVHQTNMDSMAKIDIYRNSIGKLEGMTKEKTTVPHKKYRGIEVAIKQQKEQPNENRGRDTKAIKEHILKSREHRQEIGESGRDTVSRDKERSTPDQSQHDRGRQNNDSRTGVFSKVKGTFASLLKKDEKKEIGSAKEVVAKPSEIRQNTTPRVAPVKLPHPKILQQREVFKSEVKKENTRSDKEQQLIEKIKQFKGTTQSKSTYTPDKSKSLEERIKAFKQSKDKEVKKGKSRGMER